MGYTPEQYRNVESIPEIQSEVMTAKLPYSKAKMYLNTVKFLFASVRSWMAAFGLLWHEPLKS